MKLNSPDNISKEQPHIFEFAEFSFDAAKKLLWRDGETVGLAPKACELLGVLIEHAPQVLSKEELMNRVWNDSFVEEANLAHHISALRKALGEDKNGRKFIETIPRKGYRFVAAIKETASSESAEIVFDERERVQIVEETTFDADDESIEKQVNVAPAAAAASSAQILQKRRRRLIPVMGTIVLLLGAAAFFAYRNFYAPKNSQLTAPPEVKTKRLTPDADAIAPAVSPDGASVVFSRDENGQEIFWRKQIASGEMTQLLPASTAAAGRIIHTRFSPDGKWIYYSYVNMNGLVLFRIPAGGGSPQKIRADVFTDFAISPDGKQIAYCFDFRQIIVVDIETGEKRIAAERDNVKYGFKGDDYDSVAWSPDGLKLAAAGSFYDGSRNIQQLLEIDVKTGAEKVIAIGKSKYEQIEWLADNSGLIVTQAGRIAFVNMQTGTTEYITSADNSFSCIRLSADSKTLIAQQSLGHYNIWTAPAGNLDKKRQITIGAAARQGASGIALLPDGKIVYTSTESGAKDIWTMKEDGSEPRQLTINAASNARPVTTRDGRYIVFNSNRSGTDHVWRMDADGRNPVQLSQGQESWECVFGPDNQIYYITTPTDGKKYLIFKVPVEGGVEPVEFEQSDYQMLPQFSPDGKWFLRWGGETGAELAKVSLMETATGKLVRTYKNSMASPRWSFDSKNIYFISPAGQEFWRQPLEGEAEKLSDFRPMKIAAFALSADNKNIVFSLGTSTSEIGSIENFLTGKVQQQ